MPLDPPIGEQHETPSTSSGASSPSGSPNGSTASFTAHAEQESRVLPDPPSAVRELFGDRFDLAVRYAELLVTDGVVRGLIGPREAPRIWDRHILNCAVVADLVPSGAFVVDVGSGAGLPGIVLSVVRPDLSVTLVEPLARRIAFLDEVISALGLTETITVRARAEDCVGRLRPADVVTARAVAPLDRLAAWCLPLAAVGGRLLALKGASATEEAATHGGALTRLGAGSPVVRECGVGLLEPPTTVIDIVRERAVPVPGRKGGGRRRPGR